MTKQELEKRQKFLLIQGRALIRAGNDDKAKDAFIKIRDLWSARITKKFDPVLSRKIDCLTYLIEN